MIDYETYKVGDKNEILVIELVGSIDVATSQFLLDCIQGHIEDGMHKIVLDCTNLEYISSMGLGTMVRANSRLKKIGGAVALAGVQGMIADVIHVAHLDRLFNMFPTVRQAADSLR